MRSSIAVRPTCSVQARREGNLLAVRLRGAANESEKVPGLLFELRRSARRERNEMGRGRSCRDVVPDRFVSRHMLPDHDMGIGAAEAERADRRVAPVARRRASTPAAGR